ncbi:MAG TPA: DUF1080 domain-containing protein [Bacteroidales bacterium]|nr:DUF1080 domain-containing protein [Bacteroidales bacterium]
MQLKYIILWLIPLSIASGFATSLNAQITNDNHPGKLTDGWTPLFDGKTTNGWRGYNQDSVTPNWTVKNGVLHADGTKGDIISVNQYGDFELSFDWKISRGGNSGVFYHVVEGPDFPTVWHTGIEMQIMDNARNPLGKKPVNSAMSLYAMYAPVKDMTKPAGEWNHSILVVKQGHVEYWLNGELVNQYTLWNQKWYNDRDKTIHHFSRKPFWGEFRKGHIALQDEGFPVSFRDIRIRIPRR